METSKFLSIVVGVPLTSTHWSPLVQLSESPAPWAHDCRHDGLALDRRRTGNVMRET